MNADGRTMQQLRRVPILVALLTLLLGIATLLQPLGSAPEPVDGGAQTTSGTHPS